MADHPEFTRNEEAGRFELDGSPETAQLAYQRSGDRLVLVHTEVADEHEGKGIAGALVRTALAHADAEGLTIVPQCPFVAEWLDRHPDETAGLDIAAP